MSMEDVCSCPKTSECVCKRDKFLRDPCVW